jgi:nucleotide-binding universal stress UspA family protein
MEIAKVQFKHILYTTDFSENAKYACSYAKSIADQYNSEVILLHVIKDDLPDFLIFDAGNERSPKGVTNRLEMQKEYFEDQKVKLVDKIKKEYCFEDTHVNEIIVERGNPVKVITRIAEERNCDLIVMGVKGRNSIEDVLMGDTARRVITRAKSPVLVVSNKVKK